MRGIGIFLILVLFATCQSAEDARPGNAETYIKLIGSEFQDTPSQFLPITSSDGTDNGVLILGTTEDEVLSQSKIRLTRLDNNGNTIWERTFPALGSTDFSLIGRSIVAVNDGYFIIGDNIPNEGEDEDGEQEDELLSQLLVMKVDLDGIPIEGMSITDAIDAGNVRGKNGVINEDGDLAVISEIIREDSANQVLFTAYNTNDLSISCRQVYSEGSIALAQSFVINASGSLTFAGTSQDNGTLKSRVLVLSRECNSAIKSAVTLLNDNDNLNNYTVNQIINTINGPVIIGTTDASGLKTDIFLARLDAEAERFTGDVIIYDELEGKRLTDEEEGLAIASTSDGGFIITGSTRTNTGAGETNIVLIKTDAFGSVEWTNQFGDLNEEEGVFVKQTPDGGYYVLGGTEFGGLDTIILIRTDSEGNVE